MSSSFLDSARAAQHSLSGGRSIRADRLELVAVIGLFLLAVILVNPFREAPFEDDWAYAETVRHFLDTGQYRLNGWLSANIAFQTLWGSLFCQAAGFSFAALRLSTVALAVIGLAAFRAVAVEHGITRHSANLLAFCIASSPLFFKMSLTFMSDVPFVATMSVALWLYTRAIRQSTWIGWISASVAGAAAILTRQFGVALLGGLSVIWLADARRFERFARYAVAALLPAFATLWQLDQGWNHPNWAAAHNLNRQRMYLWGGGTGFLKNLPWRPLVIVEYLAWFLMPLALVAALSLVGQWQKERKSPGFPARPPGRRLPFALVGWTVVFVAGVLYGARILGTPLLMPFLPWNFEILFPLGTRVRFLVTAIAVGGAVCFAPFLLRRWFRVTDRPFGLSEWFLDLTAIFSFLFTLVFFTFGDEYLLVLLPYAAIAIGRQVEATLLTRSRTVFFFCLLLLAGAAVWTREELCRRQAIWTLAERVHLTGVPADQIFAGWEWAGYHQFDEYARTAPPTKVTTFADFFDRWMGERRALARVLIVHDLHPPPGERWRIVERYRYFSVFGRGIEQFYAVRRERTPHPSQTGAGRFSMTNGVRRASGRLVAGTRGRSLMTRRSRRPARRGMLAAALVLLATWGASAPVYSRGAQPNDPSIRDAIARGSQYLIRSAPHADGGRAAVGALGLVKTGTPADNPAIVQVIEQKLLPKFDKDGQYKPTAPTDLYYEAGVDLMVYANTRPQEYGKQISFLVNLLIDAQHEEGYWSYPPTARNPERGDTSITQYALLGLWDARRAGVPIPTGVFDKAASWLKTTQDSDGGFWYHPGNDRYPPTHSMVAAGTANLLVCRQNLFGPGAAPASHHANSARFGVLKKIELEPVIRGEGKHAHAASGPVKVARSGVDSGVRRGFEWLNRNWIGAQSTYYQFYYYYALERACSLAGVDKIGDHDWYDEISDGLLKAQSPDGGWSGQSGAVADTAFALLFLSRATAKIIHHKPGEKLFEGGLMIGGRGLPTNLSAIQAGADGIRLRKLEAPVDSLLSELENPKSTNVEAAQQAIVESVELGDREKLVGQKERLKRLCRDPRTEVRRTAIWALGRCATIRDANVLVRALDDPEISVVIEANNALCWLARRPNGFGRAADPIAELPEGATDQRKEVAARSWRKDVRSDWRTWFANVRPYAERNLPLDAN